MDALESILTTSTVLLALAVSIVTMLARRGVELRWPTLTDKTPLTKEQVVWEKLLLPTLPVVLCVAFVLLVKPTLFDYPAAATRSTYARVLYGIGTGWFAEYGYKAVTFFIKKKWNIAAPGDSTPPPGDP